MTTLADRTDPPPTSCPTCFAASSTTPKRSQRDDLCDRLEPWLEKLDQPKTRVVVVGQFKQGKSALVNSVIDAPVCPIDDVFATAIPTVIQFGPEPKAALVIDRSARTGPVRSPWT